MTIAVRCPHCSVVHQVDEQMRGTQAKCACGGILTVPLASKPQQARPQTRPSAAAQSPSKIIIQCPKCGQRHQADRSMAGTTARCNCGTVLQIPAPQAPPQAAASGVASLLDELTEQDRAGGLPAQKDLDEPQVPTEDEILSQYVYQKESATTQRRELPDVRRPICTILLGILDMFPAVFFLGCGLIIVLAMFMPFLQGARPRVPAEDVAEFAEVTFKLIVIIILYLSVGALYLFGGIGLFRRWQYGWWFNLCMTVLCPISKIAGLILLPFADVTRGLAWLGETLGRFKIADLISIPLAIAITVYLLQGGVMQFYGIQQSRLEAVVTAVVISLLVVLFFVVLAFI